MRSFISTRAAAGAPTHTFAEAVFQGLAADGGLFVPQALPRFSEDFPEADTFARSAAWAAEQMLGDALPREVIRSVVGEALSFEAPLVEVEPGLYVLELFHGPSFAFKDVGARFMGRTMAAMDDAGAGQPRTVLVATSGDTGGAVASAFHGVEDIRVVVLFPERGVSPRQRRQMTTLGRNITAVAVAGTFDDCQRLAKGAFQDEVLSRTCRLTSANSINVGRLIPQSFYYVHAAALLGWHGPPATFVVPSGNLGNLCAGLLAGRAGLPAAGFVSATNPNRALPAYLDQGSFTPRPSVPTASNAMDVGDPSNLERIRWLYGDDVAALRRDVGGVSVDDDQTRATIADVYRRTGYVLDPHGAVAYRAAQSSRTEQSGPTVVLATAHPAKFPEIVEEATGAPVAVPPGLAARMEGVERVLEMDATDAALRRVLLGREAR